MTNACTATRLPSASPSGAPADAHASGRVIRTGTAAVAAILLATLSTSPVHAAGRLDARYVLTVAGVELGRGAVTLKADDSTYEVSGSGRISGVLRAVSSGKGQIAARGHLTDTKMVPQVYAMHAESEGKKERARIAMASGGVTSTDVHPPLKAIPDRVPVADKVLRNIIDPVSGAFVYVPGTGDLLAPSSCDRALPVFDGRQRYDLQLSFKRKESVKTKGYEGQALVCQVRYKPVAGHRPNRETVKYMQDNEDMFVWLVPIAGTRLMAPYKASISTMIGTALLEATTFRAAAGSGAAPAAAPAEAQ